LGKESKKGNIRKTERIRGEREGRERGEKEREQEREERRE